MRKSLKRDTLWIGSLIRASLEDIAPVYPLVAELGTGGDFIVYRRTGYGGRGTKDGLGIQSLKIEITAVSKSYDRSLEMAEHILRFDGRRVMWKDIPIDRITLIDATESYSEPQYVQTLTFVFDIDLTFDR